MISKDSEKRIVELARSFPSLIHRFAESACGLEPWDPAVLAEKADTWSPAERQIVAFLLNVWRPGHCYGRNFNPFEAITHWSEKDRQALIQWALNPFSFYAGQCEDEKIID